MKKLPTIQELTRAEVSKENDLQVLLNQPPPKDWVKVNERANNSNYIPIDKIEYLLTRIFVKWYVEILNYNILANSAAVHVRLYYQNPITGEMMHQDGIGASPIQTDKDAGPTDFTRIKAAGVQMALPAAETYAIKDAAEKIGRIFGKDLNRKDLMNYTELVGRFEKIDPLISEQLELINDAPSLDNYLRQLQKNGLVNEAVKTAFRLKAETL